MKNRYFILGTYIWRLFFRGPGELEFWFDFDFE